MTSAMPHPIYHSYSAWSRLGHVHRVTTHHGIKPFIYAYTFVETRRRNREDNCIAGAARAARSLGCT